MFGTLNVLVKDAETMRRAGVLARLRVMAEALTDDGVRIAYRSYGSGRRTVMMLHAWGGSGAYFERMIAHLDLDTLRVIAPDLRGHGDSEKPPPNLSWERLASDVFAVADDASVGAFVALGVSMGGKLAQFLPLADASRVEGMILISTPWAGELPMPDEVAAWPARVAGDAKAFLAETVLPFLKVAVPQDVLRVYGENGARIPREYLQRTLELVSHTSFLERMHEVKVPALVIASHDELHSPAEKVVASLPNARIEYLDCGLEVPLELPAETAALIEAFLAREFRGDGDIGTAPSP